MSLTYTKKDAPVRQVRLSDRDAEASKYFKSNAFGQDLQSLPHIERTIGNELGEKMLNRFGTDMRGIHIFEDEGLKESFNQRGYVRGNEIHVAKGEFSPNTPGGEELLMHEAAHIVQQGSGMVTGQGVVDNSALEAQADSGFAAPANFTMPFVTAMSAVQGWNPFSVLTKRFINNHQNAVDQFNNNPETYNKMSWWDRLKWTVANPLARIFANAEIQSTHARNVLRDINDQKAVELKNESGSIPLTADCGLLDQNYQPEISNNDSLGNEVSQAGIRERLLDLDDELTSSRSEATSDMIKNSNKVKSISNMASIGGSVLGIGAGLLAKSGDKLSKVNRLTKSDQAFGGISGISKTLGNAADAIGNTFSMMSEYEKGNKVKAAQSALGTLIGIGNADAEALRMGAYMANAGSDPEYYDKKLLPVMGVMTGAIEAISGGMGLASATSTRIAMSKRIKDLDYSPQQLTKDDARYLKMAQQAKSMAQINQMSSGIEIASSLLNAGGSALQPGGFTSIVGYLMSGIGKGINVVAKSILEDDRKNQLYDDVVDKKLNLNQETEKYITKHKGATPEDAKYIILKSKGYETGTVKEAFQNITIKRSKWLMEKAKKGDQTAKDFLKDLGIYPDNEGNYNLQGIAEKMGMDSGSSWEEQMEETKKAQNPLYNPFQKKAEKRAANNSRILNGTENSSDSSNYILLDSNNVLENQTFLL